MSENDGIMMLCGGVILMVIVISFWCCDGDADD